ncbi:hypothetical protein [Sandaracinus amylolyticus]|uniref:hypothetical protein n=1 Tax=Sandaracinus amylolyticus TaxID=927083 RepID=UPI001F461EFF|nr:hypothetical protein [Sandaracinus amylolyticus]UJR82338.1 Hypothetical protein I5071_44030 [Sandaracinus amylolyticus]
MRPALALSLSLALTGCAASTSSSQPTTPARAGVANRPSTSSGGTCQLDRAMGTAEIVEVPGTRVSLRLPRVDELVLVRGGPFVVHECGLAISIDAAPPGLDTRTFLDEVSQDLRSTQVGCRESRSAQGEPLWACDANGIVVRARRIELSGAGAIVSVLGPAADVRAIETILASARVDPTATYDALAQMSVVLDPPEGMTLRPTSIGGALEYELVGSASVPPRTQPSLVWLFVPWDSDEQHADGSAWTDLELGRFVGGLVGASDIDQVRESTMQGGVVGPGVFEMTVEGVVEGVPVTVWTWAMRDDHGAYVVMGRAPTSESTLWLDRWRAHAGTLAFMD